jgi:hypothetical protein
MSNDVFYNFSNKIDSEDSSLKLNIDELYNKKQQQDLNVLKNYNNILIRIHNKIRYTSKNLLNQNCCWYIMPEMILGVPKYDHRDCTAYVIEKLRANGFIVRYTHPNLLFISWIHWVPAYVRSEIKKKTGNSIDENGNIIIEENNANASNNNNTISNGGSINSEHMLFSNNKNNKTASAQAKDYKDIKTYKPSGNLIYNNSLLEKINIK